MLKHRTFIFLLYSLLASAFIVSSAVAQRGIVPVPIKDKAGNQVGLYKGSYALIIGVSDYTNGWPDLPEVKEDLIAVREVLEQIGFLVYTSLNPQRKDLEGAINGFISKHGYEKDNRLLIYFAGHGHTIVPKYGGMEMGYIVPSDAPNPSLDEQGFLRVGLSMQNIEVYARNIQSKHALFVFDSCFSGSIFSLSRAIPQVIQEKTNKPVRQFITAGRANQTVPDVSIFRRQFIKALKGEGDYNKDFYVTASELGQYLEDTVTNYSKGSQTPQYGKLRDPTLDQGDFVFPISASVQMEVLTKKYQREGRKIEQDSLEEEQKQQKIMENFEAAQRKFEEDMKRLEEKRADTLRLEEKFKQIEKENARKIQREKQELQNQKDRFSRLEERSQVPDQRAIGLWEFYGSRSVYRRMSKNTKQIASLKDGKIVPVLQHEKHKKWVKWVWMKVEYKKGEIGWVVLRPSEDGQWVKKY